MSPSIFPFSTWSETSVSPGPGQFLTDTVLATSAPQLHITGYYLMGSL